MKREKVLETLFVLSMALLLLFWISHISLMAWASVVVGITAIAFPSLSELLAVGWMKLSHGLGLLMTPLVLGLVFFCILFPVALLYRLFRSKKHPQPDGPTQFEERDHLFSAEDFTNTW